MDKQSTEHNEETLVAMLASFRKEACYHDNFEEDFLRNFHLNLQNFRGWQWVYASMSIVTLAAVGVIIASGNMDDPSDSYASSTKDKEEILLKEKAVPVSKETIEQPSTEVAPAEKPEFTTGAPSYETSANDNQLKTDSNTDKKPVSRVLIEM